MLDSCYRDDASLIEPTLAMIEAGLDILHRSGAVETPLGSDRELVREIYLAMCQGRFEGCNRTD